MPHLVFLSSLWSFTLVGCHAIRYHFLFLMRCALTLRWIMSIDKSLRRKNTLSRTRSVMTRNERIEVLQKEEKWKPGQSPFGLPKVRVFKIVLKKAKKEKVEEAPAKGKKK